MRLHKDSAILKTSDEQFLTRLHREESSCGLCNTGSQGSTPEDSDDEDPVRLFKRVSTPDGDIPKDKRGLLFVIDDSGKTDLFERVSIEDIDGIPEDVECLVMYADPNDDKAIRVLEQGSTPHSHEAPGDAPVAVGAGDRAIQSSEM